MLIQIQHYPNKEQAQLYRLSEVTNGSAPHLCPPFPARLNLGHALFLTGVLLSMARITRRVSALAIPKGTGAEPQVLS